MHTGRILISRSDVQKAKNELSAHKEHVKDFKAQPGYKDFDKEGRNHDFVSGIESRNKTTQAEVKSKDTVASWDLSIDFGLIKANTRPELPPSKDHA